MAVQKYEGGHQGNNYHGFKNALLKHSHPSHERPLLLAFTGKLGSGKTTAAAYIRQQYGGVKIPLARALKLEVYDMLAAYTMPLTTIIIPDPVLPDAPHSFAALRPTLVLPSDTEKVKWIDDNKAVLRPLLQWYGTEYRRSQNPNYWIDQCITLIGKAIIDGEYVITVDDLRFHNEAQALADIGFNIIKLTAGDEERVGRVKQRDNITVSAADSHASETETDALAAHYYLENSHEVFQTNAQLDSIVLQILNKE